MMRKHGKGRLFTAVLALLTILALYPSFSALAAENGGTAAFGAEEQDVPPETFVPGVIPEGADVVYPDYKDVIVSTGRKNAPLRGTASSASAAKYDSRKEGQTPVRNQGGYGLCWTFSSYAALEAYMLRNGMGGQDFSEIHMAYSTSTANGNSIVGEFSHTEVDCGGNRETASAYLMRGTGLNGTVDEAKDPYPANGASLDRGVEATRAIEKGYTVRNILFLTDNKHTPTAAETQVIKNAVVQYGGVGASMYWQGNATASSNDGAGTYYNSTTHAYYFLYGDDCSQRKPKWI